MHIRHILLCLAAVSVIAIGCAGDDANRSADKALPSAQGESDVNSTDTASRATKRRDPSGNTRRDRPARHGSETSARRQSGRRERASAPALKTAREEGPASGDSEPPKKADEGRGSSETDTPKKADEGPGTEPPSEAPEK